MNSKVAVSNTKKAAAKRRAQILRLIGLSALLAMVAVLIVNALPSIVMAGDVEAVDAAIDAAVKAIIIVLRVICIAIGGFMILFGVVKTVIAHSQDNGPDQSKALVQAGAGLALVILGTVVMTTLQDPIKTIISSAATVGSE